MGAFPCICSDHTNYRSFCVSKMPRGPCLFFYSISLEKLALILRPVASRWQGSFSVPDILSTYLAGEKLGESNVVTCPFAGKRKPSLAVMSPLSMSVGATHMETDFYRIGLVLTCLGIQCSRPLGARPYIRYIGGGKEWLLMEDKLIFRTQLHIVLNPNPTYKCEPPCTHGT